MVSLKENHAKLRKETRSKWDYGSVPRLGDQFIGLKGFKIAASWPDLGGFGMDLR
jgi:hypothetical protein